MATVQVVDVTDVDLLIYHPTHDNEIHEQRVPRSAVTFQTPLSADLDPQEIIRVECPVCGEIAFYPSSTITEGPLLTVKEGLSTQSAPQSAPQKRRASSK